MSPLSSMTALLPDDPAVFAMPVLLAVAAVGLLTALAPRLFGKSDLQRRMQQIVAGPPQGRRQRGASKAPGGRRRSVDEVLKELEAKQQERRRHNKLTLKRRLAQAGLDWTLKTYGVVSLVCAVAAFVVTEVGLGIGPLPALGFGIAGGLFGPRFIIDQTRKTRFGKFTNEFPNALDVIVRGVKSGLPLIDCLKIVAAESREPVRSEFGKLLEDQTVGIPLDEAVFRLFDRMPIPETNFFAIVIALQSRTGGSLAEAIGNLSRVLRERRKLAMKIKALSSEAKASAGIIAALPIAVTVLVYFTTPDYIMLLFTTLAGQLTLAGSAIWMFMGLMVMRKMINFKY